MDDVEIRDHRLGIETHKVGDDAYISKGCHHCNPESIIEYCFNCDRLYIRNLKTTHQYTDCDITLEQLYEALLKIDPSLKEDLE